MEMVVADSTRSRYGQPMQSRGCLLSRSNRQHLQAGCVLGFGRQIALLPAIAMIGALKQSSFSRVFINCRGYADSAVRLDGELAGVPGSPPSAGKNGDYVYFRCQKTSG